MFPTVLLLIVLALALLPACRGRLDELAARRLSRNDP